MEEWPMVEQSKHTHLSTKSDMEVSWHPKIITIMTSNITYYRKLYKKVIRIESEILQ